MSDIFSTVKKAADPMWDIGYTGVEVEVGPKGGATITFYNPEPFSKTLTPAEVVELRDYLARTLEDNARAAAR